jgi:hypothetical protein
MPASPHPHLRLVGVDDPIDDALQRARREVTAENRRAAGGPDLDPTDPRWVVAVRAYSKLQGSMLTPQKRDQVLDTAKKLGVRPFDANLIIAVVQDQARRGQGLAAAADTIRIVPRPRRRGGSVDAARWALALISAILGTLWLIQWVG